MNCYNFSTKNYKALGTAIGTGTGSLIGAGTGLLVNHILNERAKRNGRTRSTLSKLGTVGGLTLAGGATGFGVGRKIGSEIQDKVDKRLRDRINQNEELKRLKEYNKQLDLELQKELNGLNNGSRVDLSNLENEINNYNNDLDQIGEKLRQLDPETRNELLSLMN